MAAPGFARRALAPTVASCALGLALTTGVPTAGATSDQDRLFLEIVEELDVHTNSPDDAVQIGRQICDTVAAGRIEAARTVRGVLGRLTGQGLEKGQAVNLIRGAVSVYCPQYFSLVGR